MATRHRLVTPPTVEPVTVAEAKTHVRVDHAASDGEIARMISSAREVCEQWTRRAFLTQTWEISWEYGDVPSTVFRLPRRPVQAVSQVATYDAAGVETVWGASNYALDDDTFRVKLASAWPSGTREVRPIVLTYVAGYGDEATDVPDAIRDAVLEVVRAQFERESPVLTRAAKDLLAPFRVYAR